MSHKPKPRLRLNDREYWFASLSQHVRKAIERAAIRIEPQIRTLTVIPKERPNEENEFRARDRVIIDWFADAVSELKLRLLENPAFYQQVRAMDDATRLGFLEDECRKIANRQGEYARVEMPIPDPDPEAEEDEDDIPLPWDKISVNQNHPDWTRANAVENAFIAAIDGDEDTPTVSEENDRADKERQRRRNALRRRVRKILGREPARWYLDYLQNEAYPQRSLQRKARTGAERARFYRLNLKLTRASQLAT